MTDEQKLPTPVQNRVDDLERKVREQDKLLGEVISALQVASLAYRLLTERD